MRINESLAHFHNFHLQNRFLYTFENTSFSLPLSLWVFLTVALNLRFQSQIHFKNVYLTIRYILQHRSTIHLRLLKQHQTIIMVHYPLTCVCVSMNHQPISIIFICKTGFSIHLRILHFHYPQFMGFLTVALNLRFQSQIHFKNVRISYNYYYLTTQVYH